jgi:methylenetetrahydrofolate dehydrogenase (NADP+)/methenyltetrahydrofolate cyclohydrolase
MRLLNGKELAGYIKERQAKQVRSLRQSHGIQPKLAIVVTDVDNQVIDVYVRMKKRYGADIMIDTDIYKVDQGKASELLNKLSNDTSVHGIIVQLPLADPSETNEILELVNPEKDVDGLVGDSRFDPATALAIMWLLTGYNIELNGRDVVLVGYGKLVGQPLEKLLVDSGITPRVVDKNTPDVPGEVRKADVIVSATGVAGLIKSDMVKHGAVVVDAGVASEGGKTVGDVAAEVYERDDLTITPAKGGVGPLTVCALFENVIRSALAVAERQKG